MCKLYVILLGVGAVGLLFWVEAARGDGPFTAQEFLDEGWVRYHEGDTAGAEANFTKAIELYPTSAKAHYSRGIARSDLGNHSGAEQDFSRAIVLNPSYAAAYENRAEIRQQLNFVSGALADANRAIELDPNSADAYHTRGLCWMDQGDHKAAIADLTKTIELDPRFGAAYIERADEERFTGDLQNALADYNRGVELSPNDLNGWDGRGEAKRLLKDYAGAIADFDQAMTMKPAKWDDECWCRVHRGLAELTVGEQIAAAREDFDAVLAMDPHNSDALRNIKSLDHVGRGLFRFAILKLKQGRTAEAQKDFGRAIAANPELRDKAADELRNAASGSMVAGRSTTTR